MPFHYKIKGEKMRQNVHNWTKWFLNTFWSQQDWWFNKIPSEKNLRKFFIKHYDKLIELGLEEACNTRNKEKIECVGSLNNFLVEHHIFKSIEQRLKGLKRS